MPLISVLVGIVAIDLIILVVIYMKAKKKPKVVPSQKNDQNVLQQDHRTKLNATDQQKHVRVYFDDKACSVEFTNFDNSQFNRLIHKQFDGTIEAMSADDIKIACPHNTAIKENVMIQVKFELEGVPFELKGEIDGKEEYRQSDKIYYGVAFVNVADTVKKDLTRTLNQIVLERRRQYIS